MSTSRAPLKTPRPGFSPRIQSRPQFRIVYHHSFDSCTEFFQSSVLSSLVAPPQAFPHTKRMRGLFPSSDHRMKRTPPFFPARFGNSLSFPLTSSFLLPPPKYPTDDGFKISFQSFLPSHTLAVNGLAFFSVLLIDYAPPDSFSCTPRVYLFKTKVNLICSEGYFTDS